MSYRIFGSSGSPYSVKIRSYFRYKDIDHEWVVRNSPENFAEHKKYSKLPIVPTLVTPEGKSLQDSTPIMETMEILRPEPSAHPPDAVLRFLSELLEEFADEWGNKWMMHFRWYSSGSGPDSESYARRISVELASGSRVGTEGLDERLATVAAGFKQRMLGRGFTVGSNEITAPIIESSFINGIVLLDRHLSKRPYMFGRSPCFADFGLAGQLYQCLQDVTASELMRLYAPNVANWSERMVNPRQVGGGAFETWNTLGETLEPFLSSQVSIFLRWSVANAKALVAGQVEMTIELGEGLLWKQSLGGPQRYHAKSLTEIRRKFQAVSKSAKLVEILERCGCLSPLVESLPSRL